MTVNRLLAGAFAIRFLAWMVQVRLTKTSLDKVFAMHITMAVVLRCSRNS